MPKFTLLFNLFFILFSGTGFSQKVKRFGTNPIEVTKNNSDKNLQFNIDQFYGRWQEIKRNTKTKIEIPISDTIYLHFTSPNKVQTRDGFKTNMRGEALIEDGNILVAAADIYKVVSASADEIILDNQENIIHTLRKKDHFLFETYGKDSVKKETYQQLTSFSLTDITGNWRIYKRSAKPGREMNDAADWLTYINIIPGAEQDSTTAEIKYISKEVNEKRTCTVTIENERFVLKPKDGNEVWAFRVYKADENEFIFGEAGNLLFFAKPLK